MASPFRTVQPSHMDAHGIFPEQHRPLPSDAACDPPVPLNMTTPMVLDYNTNAMRMQPLNDTGPIGSSNFPSSWPPSGIAFKKGHSRNSSSQQSGDAIRMQMRGRSLTGWSSSKHCYRHDPELKAKRLADGPSLEHLRQELSTTPDANAQQGIGNAWAFFQTAPAKQRELLLQGLLAQCCFPQLSFVSSQIRDLLKIDFLTALPTELGLKILCFLDPTSLCRAAQVSHSWRDLADDDVIWHRMCEQHIDRKCTECGWGLPLLDQQRIRTEKRLMQLHLSGQVDERGLPYVPATLSTGLPDNENPYISTAYESDDSEMDEQEHALTKADSKKRSFAPPVASQKSTSKKICGPLHNYSADQLFFQPSVRPWKFVYRDRFKVGTNWKYGRSEIKILKGHTNGVMCLQFDDHILATGSYDSTIKLWDLETGTALRTLTGHTLGVRCLQFDQTKLVSGSLDGTLKMWNLKTGKVVRTFPGHSGAVISLHFDGMILASGSQDKTIRVRNFQSCSRVVLRGHTDWVNAVKVHAASNTLFSASDDCTVRVWDLEAKRCIRVISDHVGQVQAVLPLPREFEFPDPDENGDEMDVCATTVEKVHTAIDSPQQQTAVSRASPPRYMLTGSLDSTIRLWEISTGRCIRTFFGHLEGVWCMAADSLRLVSGSNDGMVKIWDPRTGKCERTITGHNGPVTCIGLSDRRMVSGSEDHTLRLYDFGGPAQIRDMNGASHSR